MSLSHSWYQSLPSRKKNGTSIWFCTFSCSLHAEGKDSLWLFPLSGLIIDPKYSENGTQTSQKWRAFWKQNLLFCNVLPSKFSFVHLCSTAKKTSRQKNNTYGFFYGSNEMVSQKVLRLEHHGSVLYSFLSVWKGSYKSTGNCYIEEDHKMFRSNFTSSSSFQA